jgi:hypothetical protein
MTNEPGSIEEEEARSVVTAVTRLANSGRNCWFTTGATLEVTNRPGTFDSWDDRTSTVLTLDTEEATSKDCKVSVEFIAVVFVILTWDPTVTVVELRTSGDVALFLTSFSVVHPSIYLGPPSFLERGSFFSLLEISESTFFW